MSEYSVRKISRDCKVTRSKNHRLSSNSKRDQDEETASRPAQNSRHASARYMAFTKTAQQRPRLATYSAKRNSGICSASVVSRRCSRRITQIATGGTIRKG